MSNTSEVEHGELDLEPGKVIPLNKGKIAEQVLKNPKVKEGIEGALNKIKGSGFWKKVENYWVGISEKDKEALYKEGEPGILKAIATAGPVGMGVNVIKNQFVYENRVLKAGGDKLAGAARTLMQMGLLTHPAKLTQEQLQADVVSDGKTMKKMLRMVKLILVAFAPEALPEYQKIEPLLQGVTEERTRIALDMANKDKKQPDQLAA